MFQHIIVGFIVFASVFYLMYQWKLKKYFGKQKNLQSPAQSSACQGGCSGCSIAKPLKKFP